MTQNKGKETPIQIAIKAMHDEDGLNGKRLKLEQIAEKYYGGDKNKAFFAISAARQYVNAFGDKDADEKTNLDTKEKRR